jgi:hypothetical protein
VAKPALYDRAMQLLQDMTVLAFDKAGNWLLP